jgi:uncharacterized protein GlcG (DUF336 family)
MSTLKQYPVMDVLPFPQGRGFSGADAWWDYVLGKEERKRLDQLMGLALLDRDIHDRLVEQRDHALMDAFHLSAETQAWLRAIPARSLTELAQAVVAGPQAMAARREVAPEAA